MTPQQVGRRFFARLGLGVIIICWRIKIDCSKGFEGVTLLYLTFMAGFVGAIFIAIGDLFGQLLVEYIKKNLKNERLGYLFRNRNFNLLYLS